MVDFNELFYLRLVFLVALPAAVGLAVTRSAGDWAKRRSATPPVVRGIRLIVTVIWIALVSLGLSATFGPLPATALSALTVSAIGGIAVTLALQTTLQNLIAGFILLRNRFIRLGDVVQLGSVKGTVVSLGLINTVLKMEDGTLAFTSNANVLAGPLLNFTAGRRLAGEY